MHTEKRIIGFICIVVSIALCYAIKLPYTLPINFYTVSLIIVCGILIPIGLLYIGIKLIIEGSY
jgi:hypothetical protein